MHRQEKGMRIMSDEKKVEKGEDDASAGLKRRDLLLSAGSLLAASAQAQPVSGRSEEQGDKDDPEEFNQIGKMADFLFVTGV